MNPEETFQPSQYTHRWSLQQLGWHFISVLIGGTLTLLGLGLFNRTQPAPIMIAPPAPTATAAPTATPRPLNIYINGAVQNPSVYQLPPRAILQDALNAAGGFTEEAQTTFVNLAQPLSDGMQIYIPDQDETEVIYPTPIPPVTDQALINSGENSPESPPSIVNINTASVAQLEALPGVGPSTAAKIIAHREENGLFATAESIMDVSGIGPAKYEKMAEFIVISE